MYEGIKETVYRLFPNVVYDNGIARHYNAQLGYNTSRQLIRLVAAHKDEHDFNDTIKQLKLRYDGPSNMEVDELNLLYYMCVGLEAETHTAICECCGRVFDYDTLALAVEVYKNLNVQIPTKCLECTKEDL
jgi:hypothetical protein